MTQPPPQLVYVRTDDLEAVSTEGGGWSGSYVQLGRGRLGYRSRRVLLPGVAIRWHACEPRVLSRWRNTTGGFGLSWLLGADEPLRSRGADAHPEDALLLFPGREHDVRVPAGYHAFDVEVSASLVAARGWRVAPEALPRIPLAQRAALETFANGLVRLLKWRAPETFEPAEVRALRDRLLNELELVLGPLLTARPGERIEPAPAGAHSFGMVEAAVEQMRAMGLADPIHVPAVANGLGVSERTLYQAFRDALGIGPYEFHRLERIHAFRRALHSTPPRHGQISRAALATGFSDPSRLTETYRRLFDETPSQTLHRWSDAGGPFGRGSAHQPLSAFE
jgi:AraC family ethanolamine operon transcriptional activator